MEKLGRYVASNAAGTFLEYFDYMLYAFLAPTFAILFFPSDNPLTSLLMAWGVFSVSFIVRPFGALIFGHFGDRLGRRNVLAFSIILMAIPTISIGLIPTYAQIGILAPILLVLCRFLQGFAISSEYNGSSIYFTEMQTRYKGFLASITPCACGLGILTASLVALAFTDSSNSMPTLNEEVWRLAFIFAGLAIGIIGFYLRMTLPETPDFIRLKQTKGIVKLPFLEVLKKEKIGLLTCIILSSYVGFATYTIMVYMASYLKFNAGLDMKTALALTAMASLVQSIFAPLFGFLSDIFNRRYVLLIAAMSMAILVTPFFLLIKTGHLLVIVIALLGLGISLAAFTGPLAAFLPTRFSTPMRYSGLAVGFNIGAGVIGGSAPFILSWLTISTENHLIPGFFLLGLSLLAIITLYFLKDKSIKGGHN